jgi:hypothetical protein
MIARHILRAIHQMELMAAISIIWSIYPPIGTPLPDPPKVVTSFELQAINDPATGKGSEETIQHEGHCLEPESNIKPRSRGPRLVSEEDQRKRRTVSRLHGSTGFVGARDPKFPHAGI